MRGFRVDLILHQTGKSELLRSRRKIAIEAAASVPNSSIDTISRSHITLLNRAWCNTDTIILSRISSSFVIFRAVFRCRAVCAWGCHEDPAKAVKLEAFSPVWTSLTAGAQRQPLQSLGRESQSYTWSHPFEREFAVTHYVVPVSPVPLLTKGIPTSLDMIL